MSTALLLLQMLEKIYSILKLKLFNMYNENYLYTIGQLSGMSTKKIENALIWKYKIVEYSILTVVLE